MRIALVGCGYVADFYMTTLANHPRLELEGVFDRDPDRAARFCAYHAVRRYESLEALLGDQGVEMVVNLTNPGSHHSVSLAALQAGKHVYSEKPLATRFEDAEQLVAEAERRGLQITAAPANLLGEAAQTLWKALRENRIGVPRLVYAEIDDGPVPLQDWSSWVSASGAPWPAKDEFEVGCTLEHAGYYLGWLVAFFGPARTIAASAHVVMEDKGIALDVRSPDFAVATLEFATGVVARLTCSIYATHDHRIRIYGDQGVLSMQDCWDYGSPVRLSRRTPWGIRLEKHPVLAAMTGLGPRKIHPVRRASFRHRVKGSNPMDFCRGIAEVADALRDGRRSRMPARWALHVTELVLAMQDPAGTGSPRPVKTTFDPIEPMPWAL
jgi:predicted dehydrogenase